MQLNTPAQNLKKSRVDFKIEEFRKLIKQKGADLEWEMTVECPCENKSSTDFGLDLTSVTDINADSSGNNSSCPVCKGKGFRRFGKQEIKAIIAEAGGTEELAKYGVVKKQTIKITLEPEHLPSYGDRFKLINNVMIKRETVIMPAGDTVELSSPISSRTLLLAGGETDVGVMFIQRTDANGLGIDEELNQDDIQINADGTLTFLNPLTTPTEGTKFSISYYANPVYVAVSHPHSIRDTFIRKNNTEVFSPMVVQIECRLEL